MNEAMMDILRVTNDNELDAETKRERRTLRKAAVARGATWWEIRDLSNAALLDYKPGSIPAFAPRCVEPGPTPNIPAPFTVQLADNQGFAHIRGEVSYKVHDAMRYDPSVVTVAWEDLGNCIRFGFAFCAPEDNFCRRLGRSIAWQRLNNPGESWTVPASAMESNHPADLARKLLNSTTTLPTRWVYFEAEPYVK